MTLWLYSMHGTLYLTIEQEKICDEVGDDGSPSTKMGWYINYHSCLSSGIFYFLNTVHTECVIESCSDCGRPFRMYVPDTLCDLPASCGGGAVLYREPQTTCPLCDPSSYGAFMFKLCLPVKMKPD